MKLYHPTWSKYIILPVITMMLCIGYAPIVFLLVDDNEQYFRFFILAVPLALSITYYCLKGYELFKFRNVSVEIDSNSHFIVRSKSETIVLDKSDIFYKNYKLLSTIALFGKNGNKIAVFDYIHPNVKIFIGWAEDHLTT